MAQLNSAVEQVTDSRHDHHLETDHLLPTIEGRTVKGGAVSIVSHGLKFIVTLIATAVMARLLTPEDYGLIGMVAVVTSFASLFKDLGLSHATVQITRLTHGQVSTLFWINVGLSLGIAIVVAALAPFVAWFYEEPRLTGITAVVACGFVLGGLSVEHEALLKRQMRFFALSAANLISMVCGYGVGITLALRGAGYWSLVFAQLALLGSHAVAVWITCGWRPSWPKKNAGVRGMLKFGGHVTGYTTVNYFSGNLDGLLIGRFWGPDHLGFYAKAMQLWSLPVEQINEPIAAMTIPALSRLNDSPQRYREAYIRIMEKVLLLTMPCMAFMIASADWLVHLVLGPQWNFTARVFICLGIAGLLQPLANTADWLLVSQGRVHHMLRWSVISAPITMLSIAAGLPWGAVGVAASFSLGKLLIFYPLLFWYVGRTGPVRTKDFYRLIAPFAGSSIVALLSCLAFRKLVGPDPLLGIVGSFVITSVVALLVLSQIPAGKLVLRDLWELVFRPRSKEPVSQASD
ncbi:MAG TPA: lipopolysaccharide biosynthesis protein [Pyrinomonadaceae bacterium]|nr:lipopolysaccharide biosynthesis protein [Pyrinomonadaceae bacterium]